MRRVAWRLAAASLLATLAVLVPQLKAQEEPETFDERVIGYRELVRQAANTSIVWVDDESGISVPEAAGLFRDILILNRTNNKDPDTETLNATDVYENLGAAVFPVSPSEAEQAVDFARENGNEPQKKLVPAIAVTDDMIVSLMDTGFCDEPDPMNSATLPPNTTPLGVKRVGGGEGTQQSYGRRVWIVDSGLDNGSGFINVDKNLAANCINPGQCRSDANLFDKRLRDRIGHGTMIAGIIAARPSGGNNDPSLWGVAPNAVVVPVKVFDINADSQLSGAPLRALDYILAGASPGDIVNLSWGAAWLENMNRRRNNLATIMGPIGTRTGLIARLRLLVDTRQIKFVVAAGNTDPAIRPSWVQYVMPAGSGSYPSAGEGCAICTVSAIRSEQSSGAWRDTFWWDPPTGPSDGAGASGQFGSNYGHRPPDFAEPGVDVLSIWSRDDSGKNQMNTCSGTSFAAAHLSGVLLHGDPKAEFTVTGDPDSPTDKNNADPVGVVQ